MVDCYCDFEPADFYLARIRTARKEYRCDECAGCIATGEKYENVSAKWSGYSDVICTFRTCERCVELRQWVKNNVPCLCWEHHNLDGSLQEAVEEATIRAPDETRGLYFGFIRRRHMRDRFNAERRAA